MSGQRAAQQATQRRDESHLLSALRSGDDEAFRELVHQHHAALVRMATIWVRTPGTAEEVAQETWLAVIKGIDRFEGRSSLKTWIVSILINQARKRARYENRRVEFVPLAMDEAPPVDSSRFTWIGRWKVSPRWWQEDTPERLVLASETLKMIEAAIAKLPDAQRAVLVMRDIEGLDSADACNILQISESNQRVLLHRARSKLRAMLEDHLDREVGGG